MSRSGDLARTVREIFYTDTYERCYRRWDSSPTIDLSVRYMEIPVVEDIFEIPVFAFHTFARTVSNNQDIQAITVMLNTINKEPKYKTVDRYMQDVLIENYESSRLVKLDVKQGSDTVVYYGTHGAIFDRNFKPLAVCSHQIERFKDFEWQDLGGNPRQELVTRYKFLGAILRVDPQIYLDKASPIDKFIVNKLINTCLEEGARKPSNYYTDGHFSGRDREIVRLPLKVEISESPFIIRQTDVPSISTTNKQLLQLAIDHIEEFIQ